MPKIKQKDITLGTIPAFYKMCAELIEFIKNIINSPDFIDRSRQSKTDFTRQRKLPFNILVVFLINILLLCPNIMH
jgi:hypothetical protein